ncbi:MAG: hypothetical protein GTO14_04675 [Anaerolineales bacterium]|nr:hypothetical protein [Anaerolineales bacterium]
MSTRTKNVLILILLLVAPTLACNLTTPSQSPEDALATHVSQTMEAQELPPTPPPSETEVVSPAGSFRLLFLEGQDLYAMEVSSGEIQHLYSLPSLVEQSVIHLDSEGMNIAYRDEGALRVLDFSTGEEVYSLTDQETERELNRYIPRDWIDPESVLAQRYHYILDENDSWIYTSQIGWLTIPDGSWHALPSQEEMIFSADCWADVALSPDGRRVALALSAFGQGCTPLDPGLHLLDLEDGSAQTLISREAGLMPAWQSGGYSPSWSLDGDWIALTLVEPTVAPEEDPRGIPFPRVLYVVRADGSDLTQLTSNSTGAATGAIWDRNGRLYYGVIHTEDNTNAIFVYDLDDQSDTILVESNATPASLSPDEIFLVYMDDLGISYYLKAIQLSDGKIFDVPAPSGGMSMGLEFVGWQLQE